MIADPKEAQPLLEDLGESSPPPADWAGRAARSRRAAARLKTRIQVLMEPGGGRAVTGDVSAGGLFVVAEILRLPGTRVRLTLATARGSVRAEGVVRWVKRGRTADLFESKTGMGIQLSRPCPDLARPLGGAGIL